MAEFKYKAKDPSGRVRTGKIKANSKSMAKSQLRRMRMIPISVKATKIDQAEANDDGVRYLIGKYVYIDDKGAVQIELGERLYLLVRTDAKKFLASFVSNLDPMSTTLKLFSKSANKLTLWIENKNRWMIL